MGIIESIEMFILFQSPAPGSPASLSCPDNLPCTGKFVVELIPVAQNWVAFNYDFFMFLPPNKKYVVQY